MTNIPMINSSKNEYPDPDEELAEYLIQYRENDLHNFRFDKTFILDINEHPIINILLNRSRESFSNDVKKGIIKAYIYYFCEPDRVDLHRKISDKFKNIDFSIRIPENVKFNDISPDEHEGKIITFSCEILTYEQRESVTVSAKYKCFSCGNDAILDVNTDYVKCDCGDKKLKLENVKTKSIQRILCRDTNFNTDNFSIDNLLLEAHGRYVGKVEMGQRMMITGILRSISMKKRQGQRLATNLVLVDIIHAERLEESKKNIPTPEQINHYKELSQRGQLLDLLIDSFGYNIYEDRDQKLSLLLSLAGGTKTEHTSGLIHVLFIGDPSTGKSELAKWIKKISHRASSVTGSGTTKAGLGIGMQKLPDGRMVPVAGPIVRCSGDPKTGDDFGHVIIEEFSTMEPEDMDSLRESMAQLSWTKTVTSGDVKAPAVTTIVACSNPQYGKWDVNQKILDNIDLPPPIISRFDLKWRYLDIPNRERDKAIMRHKIEMDKGLPDGLLVDKELIEFFNYVRNRKPDRIKNAMDKLTEYYADVRSSGNGGDRISIEVRQGAAVISIATAFAKLMLKDKVDLECVNLAIGLYERSVNSFGVDIKSGITSQSNLTDSHMDKDQKFHHIFSNMKDEDTGYVHEEDLIKVLVDEKEYKSESHVKNVIAAMCRDGKMKHVGSEKQYLYMP